MGAGASEIYRQGQLAAGWKLKWSWCCSLELKFVGQAIVLETQAVFLCYSLEIEFLFLLKTLVLPLKVSVD